MDIKDILVKIGNYDDTINKEFPNKDVVTIDELINKIDDLHCEVEHLEEELEEAKRVKTYDDEYDPYDRWLDHIEGIR